MNKYTWQDFLQNENFVMAAGLLGVTYTQYVWRYSGLDVSVYPKSQPLKELGRFSIVADAEKWLIQQNLLVAGADEPPPVEQENFADKTTDEEDGLELPSGIVVVIYNLYSHWASALVNGDRSGLTEEDGLELDAWLESEDPGWCAGVEGESFFGHPDCNGLQGDLLEFRFHQQQ